MMTHKTRNKTVESLHVKLEVFEGEATVHDYGIPRQAWIRGIKLMTTFGADRALTLIDERAEQAADRGDIDTSRRWRTLITAIHAMLEDERLLGENMH